MKIKNSQKKKVLVLTTCYPLNRNDISSIFLKTLYKAIALKNEHDITIIAADHSDTSKEYDKKNEHYGMKIIRYPYLFKRHQKLLYGDAVLSNIKKHPFYFLFVPFLVISLFVTSLRMAYKVKFDIIHAHWALPAGFIGIIIGKLFKIPVIVTSHGGDIYGLKGRVVRKVIQFVFSNAQITNAVSEPLKNEIHSLSPNAKIVVKSMGVNERIFSPLSTFQTKQLRLPKNKHIILFVGRFSEKKGVEYLIEAVELLKARQNVFLLMVGEGNLKNKIVKMIKKKNMEDIVTLTGSIPNHMLPVYYSAAHVLVVPSVVGIGGQEGLPVTIMEGLLCEKTIVTTPIGGISWLKGIEGIIFSEPKNSKDLADKIEKALLYRKKNSKSDIRAEGMRFSIDTIARGFIHMYANLIGKR